MSSTAIYPLNPLNPFSSWVGTHRDGRCSELSCAHKHSAQLIIIIIINVHFHTWGTAQSVTEQNKEEALFSYSVNDQIGGKKKKKESSVDLKKVRIKKYQVEEFNYFFSQTKRVERFLPFFREQNDLESNEGTEYLRTVKKTHRWACTHLLGSMNVTHFLFNIQLDFFSFEAILHLNVINGGVLAVRVKQFYLFMAEGFSTKFSNMKVVKYCFRQGFYS